MSRRRALSSQEIPHAREASIPHAWKNARKAPDEASQTQEVSHAALPPRETSGIPFPGEWMASQPSLEPQGTPSDPPPSTGPVAATPSGRFPSRDEQAEVMKLYKKDGICPLCKVRIGGKGITGHVSKCLRSSKLLTESTTIS